MVFSLHVLTCALLVYASAASYAQNEEVSFMQSQVYLPNVGALTGSLDHRTASIIASVTEVVQTATNTIATQPAIKVLAELDKYLTELDQKVWNSFGIDLKNTTDAVANAINTLANTTDNVADSAGVNAALKVAVQSVDEVTLQWSELTDSFEIHIRSLLNDLATVGFKDLSQSLSDALDAALMPFEKTNAHLRAATASLERSAQPWTSNAETDKPLQEGIDELEKAVSAAASKELIISWINTTVEKFNEISRSHLAGDQAASLAAVSAPIAGDAQMLINDLTGGLHNVTDELEASLRRVQHITAKAAKEAGAAAGLRCFSLVVSALGLIALTTVTA